MPTLYEAVDLCDRAATVAVPASMVKSTSPSKTVVKRWRMNASSREMWPQPETRFRCKFPHQGWTCQVRFRWSPRPSPNLIRRSRTRFASFEAPRCFGRHRNIAQARWRRGQRRGSSGGADGLVVTAAGAAGLRAELGVD